MTKLDFKGKAKEIEKNIDIEKAEDMDKQIKNNIREHYDRQNLWLTESQMLNAKYPLQRCSICEQLGCDLKVEYKHLVKFYHKRCFKLFTKKAVHFSKQNVMQV